MAVTTETEFQVGIGVKDEATGPIKGAGDAAAEATGKIGKLSAATVVLNQALEIAGKAWSFAKGAVESSVGAYLEAERAQHDLTVAMRVSGQYSAGAVKDFGNFADRLQRTTLATDDQINALLRHGQAIGKSQGVTKKLTATALDLAAALKIDATAAFGLLTASLAGNAKGLARNFVELKQFGPEALRAGAAVDFLSKRLAGFAAEEAQTAYGQLVQIKKAYGEVQEAVGGVLVALFRGDAAKGRGPLAIAIELLTEIETKIKATIPQVIAFHDHVVRIGAAFLAAFREVDVVGILKNLAMVLGLTAGLFLAYNANVLAAAAATAIFNAGGLVAVIANLWAMASALGVVILQYSVLAGLMIAQGVVMALTVGAVALGIGTIAVALELAINNMGKMDKVWTATWTSVALGAKRAALAIASAMGSDTDMLRIVNDIEELEGKRDAALKGLDTGLAGKAMEEGGKFLDKLNAGLAVVPERAEEAGDQMAGAGAKGAGGAKDAEKAWKDLEDQLKGVVKAAKDAQRQAELAGLSEVDQIKVKKAAAFEEIAALETKIRAMGRLSRVVREQLAVARDAQAVAADLQISAAIQKQADDVEKASLEAARTADQAGASEIALAGLRRDAALKAIDAVRQLAIENGKLTKELEAQLDVASQAAVAAADTTSRKVKTRAVDEATPKLFSEKDITVLETFSTQGVADFAGAATKMAAVPLGMMAAANVMLDAVQKLIDFIPGIINKIAGVINSLTDLPLAIGKAVDGLLDAVTNFFSNFFTNVARMLGTFLQALLDFAVQLPEGILKALQDVPRMLVAFVDRFPDVVQRIVESLVAKVPEIALALVEVLIMRAPEIGARIAWAIMVMLPRAIVLGVINGVKAALKAAFAGIAKMRGFKVDMPDVKGEIAKAGAALKKVFGADNAQLFSVKDLATPSAGAAMDALQDLLDQADDAGRTMWQAFVDAMVAAWHWFLDAGAAIWAGLKDKIGDAAMWMRARGGEIWAGLKAAATAVVTWFKDRGAEIWAGLVAAASQVATWFAEKGKAIWDGLLAAALLASGWAVELGKAIWKGLTEAVKDPLGTFRKWGVAIWTGLTEAVKDVTKWFKDRGGDVWIGLTTYAKDVTKWFKERGGDIWNGLAAHWGDFVTIGSNIAVGLWNKIIGFDWGSLIGLPSGGGDGGAWYDPSTYAATGGMIEAAGKVVYAAGGTVINMPRRGTDVVPAMLTPGEFIVNRAQTAANLPALQAINGGRGQVAQGGPTTISITINARTNLDADAIRREVIPEIDRHLRRKSQDGGFVLASSGVR